MPTDEELRVAERRGYAKGYAAKKRRIDRERLIERERRERQAFLDRALLAALPAALRAEGWKSDDKPITNVKDRVRLAAKFAREALNQRPTP